MSYLEKLLDGEEVAWKPLGEVAEIKRGTSITKKDVTYGKIPVIAGGRTPAYFHNVSNREGQTIVIAGSGTAGFVSWWEQPIFVSDSFTVKPYDGLLSKYCFYYLQGMQGHLYALKSGGGVPHVYPRDLAPLLIPIPCPENPKKSLAIQGEIVRILDAFSALTAELTAELTARKKQYKYYRDQLLTFSEDEVAWKPLGDVAISILAGGDLPKKYLKGQTKASEGFLYPIYSNGIDEKAIYGYTNEYRIDAEAVTISARGTIGWHTIRQAKFTPIVRLIVLIPDKRIIMTKFLNYILDITEIGHSGGSIPQLTVPNVKKIKIPIPYANDPKKSLAEQARIVSILDTFDTLTSSLQEGLPREIALREKQYAYYRDLLLNFPKPLQAKA